ncbi:hypothetical protein GPA22_19690 [Aromatoleum toluvorans]|uniref:Uncharacterized protein n=1 Tax=Aromatoleum toluvorans TaxID=92002 RepID=A0ABX1Q2K4_9RHOO|nr:hypothetical protein [Aromatoleum toluvorans]NMG45944.1 hypothetical protein [Aromatoleum toluvorans]
MEDEKVVKLRRALEEATPAKPKAPRHRAVPAQSIEGDNNIQAGGGKVARQSIKGNGNVQVAGTVGSMTIRTTKGPKIEMTAPAGSLGANPAFRARIEGLLKQINDYRYQRLGKAFKFGALYGDLAKAFDLDPKNWKAIWLFDESRAAEVIPWLEAKLDSTQQGRLEKAARREGYAHTRGHLFRIEKDFLEQLGWDDDYAKQRRQLVTGKTSRADMKDVEFRRWVDYLRRELESMYGESKD